MSNALNPRPLPMSRQAFKRWAKNVYQLSRRQWLTCGLYAMALNAVALFMVAGDIHPTALNILSYSLVLGSCFALGMVLYARSDQSATLGEAASVYGRGLRNWLVVAVAWLLLFLATQFLVTIAGHVLSAVFGPLPHTGQHAHSAGQHSPTAVLKYARMVCFAAGIYVIVAGPLMAIFPAAFLVFVGGHTPSVSFIGTVLFFKRNTALMIALALILGASPQIMLAEARMGFICVVLLPVNVAIPALTAGLGYVLARESFTGREDNEPAKRSVHASALASA